MSRQERGYFWIAAAVCGFLVVIAATDTDKGDIAPGMRVPLFIAGCVGGALVLVILAITSRR